MYPLDLEEFFWAMGVGKEAIDTARVCFQNQQSLPEKLHDRFLNLFKSYLLTGGLPDAVNQYIQDRNVQRMRDIQRDIHSLYGIDASQYDQQNRLKIRRVYDLIPSNLENKKKRVVVKKIENKSGKQFSDYEYEFDYLVESGIALQIDAISNPRFPLLQSVKRTLLKLYLNDVGILTALLYQNNINAILKDERSVNLGTVYEAVVAQELRAHGFDLYYYDNKQHGEVDFLIDDYSSLSVVPLEIKSGKDYYIHSALNHFVSNEEYGISNAIVFSNSREVEKKGKITYMPIYYIMFLER
jgi:predicted AAA+ superfamily ATPase